MRINSHKKRIYEMSHKNFRAIYTPAFGGTMKIFMANYIACPKAVRDGQKTRPTGSSGRAIKINT